MRKSISLALLVAFLLTSCNIPQASDAAATPTVSKDKEAVETRVAMMLTSMPSPTNTESPAPPTTAPTNTPVENTVTPTATESTPTESAQTATETLTPTPGSDDPKVALGTPTWKTNFTGSNIFGNIDNDNTKISQSDGSLVLTGVNPNGWLGWSLTFVKQPTDFYLEGTFQTATCAGNDRYGLMFRATTMSGYFFGVTCDGKYFLKASDFEKDIDNTPIAATSGAPIVAGSSQTNRLGVMAKGSKISLYVNGKLLQDVTDSTFTDKGYFGAFISSYETSNLTVKMKEVNLWIIQ